MALNFLNDGYFAGKVGIGTESPSAKLEVNGALFVGDHTGTVTPTNGIFIEQASGVDTQIQMYTFGGSVFSIKGSNTKANIGWGSGQNRSVNFTNTGSGNISVGIGTDTPGYPLDVQSGGVGTVLRAGTAFLSIDSVGTASAPTLIFNGDSDTGIFRAAANTLAFSTAGVERMRITSAGNVGIGIDDPAARLEVKSNLYVSHPNAEEITFRLDNYGATGTDAGPLLRMFNQLGTTVINIDSRSGSSRDTYFNQGGNFGIGVTNPTRKLSVEDSSSSIIADFKYSAAAYSSIDLSNNTSFARLSSVNSDLLLSPAGLEKMRITSGGNVGIGTSTPQAALTVVKDLSGGGDATGFRLNAVSGATSNTLFGGPVSSGNYSFFQAYKEGTSAGVRSLNLNPIGGNVGIGVTGPAYKLHVNSGTTNNVAIFESSDGGGVITVKDSAGEVAFSNIGNNIYFKTSSSQSNKMAILNSGAIQFNAYGAGVLVTDASGNITASTSPPVDGITFNNGATITNQINTDVDTGTETIASVATATHDSAFFDFVIKKTTNVRSGTVYACHDGTSVAFTETSTQDLGDTSDVTLSVDISGGNMRLRATTTSDDWSVKSLIRAI